MKVLVTGGAGFLGSHVCEYYRSRRDEVVAYDNLTKHELLRTGYNAGGARDYMVGFLGSIGVELVVGDVRHKQLLQASAQGCDLIVHCAAQPAMTIALENPEYDADVNVMGAVNVLSVAKELKAPVVLCSTIHVYGNGWNNDLLYHPESGLVPAMSDPTFEEEDEDLIGFLTPLHASKKTLEIYTRMFVDSYNIDAAVFRLTGMYGPRQFGGEDHGWVANFAIRTVMDLPITVFNIDGAEIGGYAEHEELPGIHQGRDIIYVTDAVDAIARWHNNGCPSGLYNIGGGMTTYTTLGDCLAKLAALAGKEIKYDLASPRFGDLYYFACDCEKAKDHFSWEPITPVNEGLARLVSWIQENQNLFVGGNRK